MPLSFDEMVARIGRTPLAFPPGEGRLYSSSAYVLLARILEVASGRSYAELLDRYVFAPAGMTRAAEFDAEAIVAGRASDYLPSPQGPRNAAYKDYGFLTGAGSVYGTADDLLAFGRAILAGTYGEALKARAAPNGVYAANGSTNGHRAFIRLDANSGRGVVLVTNLNSGAVDLVISSVDAILSGQDPASATIPQPRVTVRPPADLGRYAGSWLPRANPNGMPFALTVRAGGLHMGDFRLYPTEGGCFFEYQFYGELCFSPRDGPPSTVRWQAPGFDLEWERAPT